MKEHVMPCACGGFVAANPDSPMAGVMRHNIGQQHARWSDIYALEPSSPRSTARKSAGDLSLPIRVRPEKREVLVALGYEW